MACSDAYATYQDFIDFWCVGCIDSDAEQYITPLLTIAASDVHMHLAAVGACDCALAAWATNYLIKLNVVDAAVYHNCRCGDLNLTTEEKRMWLEWLDRQFTLIREQKIELCSGATGADFIAVGWAEKGLTEQGSAEIIANDIQRAGETA
jgi:hypothetical protein